MIKNSTFKAIRTIVIFISLDTGFVIQTNAMMGPQPPLPGTRFPSLKSHKPKPPKKHTCRTYNNHSTETKLPVVYPKIFTRQNIRQTILDKNTDTETRNRLINFLIKLEVTSESEKEILKRLLVPTNS